MPDTAAAPRGISTITSYPMPGPHDLPAGPAGWQVDPDRAVLLVHDMQQYFLRPFSAGSPLPELIDHLVRLRRRCTDHGVPVAYTAQSGDMNAVDRGLLQDFWGPGMRGRPGERDVVAPLRPAAGDWQLRKWRYSAFFRTDLAARMAACGRDQLVIGGVYAHIGIMVSAADAFTRDIQTFVVADAVADFSAEHHRQALTWAAERCAVVLTTDQVLAQLGQAPPTRGRP
ncbi:MAG: isochorismatase family protein [Propionibacteriaceae bacterium]